MIIRRFLQFIRTASAAERAAGARALARAYLMSQLDEPERAAAEAAMTILLDDPSPQVRLSLADVLAASEAAPRHVIIGLASDQPQIAGVVLARSPLIVDAELVELVGRGEARVQRAVAERRPLSFVVSAAIAEVGAPEACVGLLDNDTANIAEFSLARIAERHGALGVVRDRLLERDDLPISVRQRLIADLSCLLGEFVAERGWLAPDRAQDVVRECLDRATLALTTPPNSHTVAGLVQHLAATRQLNTALILRALCAGNIAFLEEALVRLTGLPVTKVATALHDRSPQVIRALLRRAGIADSAYPAFQAALDVFAETDVGDEGYTAAARKVLERVLTRYLAFDAGESDHLLLLLRRFASEAARDEARRFAAHYASDEPLLIEASRAA
jgi:uncharacterized protein (DUF2336 family)